MSSRERGLCRSRSNNVINPKELKKTFVGLHLSWSCMPNIRGFVTLFNLQSDTIVVKMVSHVQVRPGRYVWSKLCDV
jgi:hypothetical protein